MSIEDTQHQEVTAQKAKLVGDEAVNAEVHKVEPNVNTESVAAQVVGKPDAAPKTVPVHEVVVATDRVITDTSDPLAVQVPDAGRGFLNLPIHALGNGSPEERLAEGSADESSDGPTQATAEANA